MNSERKLPPCVYFRHGAYYLVKKGRWIRLGKDEPSADILATAAAAKTPHSMEEAEVALLNVYRRARQNAKGRRQIEFAITWDDVRAMAAQSGWRCSVTGVEFTAEVINGKKPYAPSIDRIDSAIGYVNGNCRIVCVAANYAMNVWGDAVLRKMLASARRKKVLDSK